MLCSMDQYEDAIREIWRPQYESNASGQNDLVVSSIQSIFQCPKCKPFSWKLRHYCTMVLQLPRSTFKKPDFLLVFPFPLFRNANSKWKNKYLQNKGFILMLIVLENQCKLNHMLVLFLWAYHICMYWLAAWDEFPCARWGLFTMHSHAWAWSSLNQKMCIVAN